MNDAIEAIGQELVEAIRRVLDENGVAVSSVSRCEASESWLHPIAVIGFGGDMVRGSVSLGVPWRVLQASHPSKSGSLEDLVDWISELSNLVLGSLKTRLRAHGVLIQLGLPSTFTTSASEMSATGTPELQYRLRALNVSIRVRFSAQVGAAFAMLPPRETAVVDGIQIF